MSTFNYTSIFNEYISSENISYKLLTRAVNLPDDLTLDIYDTVYISKDITWTILSYKIYGTIDYWWLLSGLNKDYIFYAPADKDIYYIKAKYVADIINAINNQI